MKNRELYAKVKFSAVRGNGVVGKHLALPLMHNGIEMLGRQEILFWLCTEGC